MLSDMFSSVLSAIASFFTWLWDCITSFFSWLWKSIWNTSKGFLWDFYNQAVDWIAQAFAALFPSDSVDFEAHVNDIKALIAGWDSLLPIHETFTVLSLLLLYYTVKILVRYGTYIFTMVRKLLPF